MWEGNPREIFWGNPHDHAGTDTLIHIGHPAGFKPGSQRWKAGKEMDVHVVTPIQQMYFHKILLKTLTIGSEVGSGENSQVTVLIKYMYFRTTYGSLGTRHLMTNL